MELKMVIDNIKCIKHLQFEFPLDSGLYAITGENGSGKSLLIACASIVFYQMPMYDYFGRPQNASIEFTMGMTTRRWKYNEHQT
jgi:predicted ATP-binding protein involved in virulence